jgi:hypothetical protein
MPEMQREKDYNSYLQAAMVIQMSLDVKYFRIERLIKSGAECFLCALEDEIERKYIEAYLSKLVLDAKAGEKAVETAGFCNHHFYKMLHAASKQESSDHGIALIVQNIIKQLIQDLQKRKRQCKESLVQIDEEGCPVCVYLDSSIEIYYRKIVELLISCDEGFLKLFKDSKGLCLPHFMILLNTVEENAYEHSRDEVVKLIVDVEEKNLRRLNAELSGYVKRQSYKFSEKDSKALKTMMLRRLQKIVGRRGTKRSNIQATTLKSNLVTSVK